METDRITATDAIADAGAGSDKLAAKEAFEPGQLRQRNRCFYRPTICLHIIRNLETMHD